MSVCLRQTAPQDLFHCCDSGEWRWICKFPDCVCCEWGRGAVGGGSRRTNTTVTLSWFLHSCIPLCWRDDIWHRFHMLELSLFDACTNTEAETTVSKCFDAISQQSVKQKTFVAFHTKHENSVNTKGRRDQSTVAESLCLCHSIPCVSVTDWQWI